MNAVVWALALTTRSLTMCYFCRRGMACSSRQITWRNQRGVRERLLWQPATGKQFCARKMAHFVKLWEARQAVMEELFAAAV